MKRQISVIGCGWLGFPLAIHLQTKGYNVKGSTTTAEKLETLHKSSIKGSVITVNEDGITGNSAEFLSGSDIVIVNIPPGLRKNPHKNHIKEIAHLVGEVEKHNIKNLLYISSTSVFKDEENFPLINYKTKPNSQSESATQLIAIERMLQENSNFNTTILRFSGLFDDQRHPGHYLTGRQNIPNPNAPINLIHKNDCINIITQILNDNHWNITLNASYPLHPRKKDYYSMYCKTHNLALPTFNLREKSKGKVIESSKLANLLNYNFENSL